MFGPLAHSTVAGDTYLVSDPTRIQGGETYTCSFIGDQGPGANAGGMYFRYRRGDNSVISDGNAFVGTQGVSWENRIRSTFTPPSDAVFVEVIFWRAASSTYPLHVSKVMLSYGSDIIPWNNDAQASVVSAQLSVTAAVAADAQSRLSSARFEVIAAAGSDPAQLLIRADTSGSLAALVASEIAFSNVIGGAVVRVMRIVNGVVIISGKLVIGNPAAARLELDGINLRIDMYNEAGTLKFRLGRLN